MSYNNVPKNDDQTAIVVANLDERNSDVAYGKLDAAAAVTNHIVHPIPATPSIPIIAPAGVQLSFVSTSVNDAAGGTGIRSIHVHYLDANLINRDEQIVLNGTTPVLSVATNIRHVTCMHIETFGSGKAAAGNISASNGGITYSYIPTGEVRCTSSIRRVPAGYTFMVESIFGSAISAVNKIEAFLEFGMTYIQGHDFTESGILIPFMGIGLLDAPESVTLNTPFPVPEGVILAMQVTTTDAAFVTGGYTGYYKAN